MSNENKDDDNNNIVYDESFYDDMPELISFSQLNLEYNENNYDDDDEDSYIPHHYLYRCSSEPNLHNGEFNNMTCNMHYNMYPNKKRCSSEPVEIYTTNTNDDDDDEKPAKKQRIEEETEKYDKNVDYNADDNK
jgi:hypothetical protein